MRKALIFTVALLFVSLGVTGANAMPLVWDVGQSGYAGTAYDLNPE